MKNRILLITTAALFSMNSFAQIKSTYKDVRDNKVYNIVAIGTQTWMAENLAFHANNGCWAYDNNPDNVATYGYLYDWKTAKSVCPSGWHLPTRTEWKTLSTYLGGYDEKLVEKGTSVWKTDPYRSNSPNMGTNETGFSAIPGGMRYWNGKFNSLGTQAYWWSSTEGIQGSGAAYYRGIQHQCVLIENTMSNTNCFSVRCLKD
jgi:uncharacterized protein (TIGR02145 family)